MSESGRKLRKRVRERGTKIRKFLQTFKIEQRAHIDIEPASHKRMPHPRFQGVGLLPWSAREAELTQYRLKTAGRKNYSSLDGRSSHR